MTDDATPRAAAVADLAEPGDVAEAEVAGDVDLVGRLQRVRGEPVDLARCDPGVVECGLDRPQGQHDLRVRQALAPLGLADADDRRRVPQHAHRPTPPSPRTVRTDS